MGEGIVYRSQDIDHKSVVHEYILVFIPYFIGAALSKNVVKREGFREKDKKGGSGHIRSGLVQTFSTLYMYICIYYMCICICIYICSVNFFSISTVGLWDVIVILTAKHFLNVCREVIH